MLKFSVTTVFADGVDAVVLILAAPMVIVVIPADPVLAVAPEKLIAVSDVPTDATARTNIGVAIGSDVQAFFSASAGTNANGARTVSTNAPSGGSDGDIWYKYT